MSVLTKKAIGEIDSQFIIPDYQRGYRWEEFNIEQLLNDLYYFSLKDESTTYFLQPVVLKKLEENTYEVIDGQQRLTTLYLLGKLLGKNEEDPLEVNYSLEYNTNSNLQDYLNKLTDSKIEIQEEEYKSDINKYYMYKAYNKMDEWFKNHKNPGPARGKIRSLLQLENRDDSKQKLAKVIWYETDSKSTENEFRKLNDFSIKLTNAELIKAMILRFKKTEDGILKHQIITASQWDAIEKTLSNESFFGFLSNEPLEFYNTKIDLLFELHFNKKNNKYNKYETLFEVEKVLEEKSEIELWNEIYHSFEIINSWYHDKILYHKIGFLVSTSNEEIIPLLLDKAKTNKHSELHKYLDELIKNKMKNFDFENSQFGDKSVRDILILYNVILILKNENNKNFFPFYLLKNKKWDIEHIQPRSNAQFINNKDMWDEWRNNNFIDTLETRKLDQIYQKSKTLTNFLNLYNEVIEENFKSNGEQSGDWLNGIGNLCLLEKGNNIAVSNYLFETKRKKVMEFDKHGDYIPPGTKKCFMRYFKDLGVGKNDFWSKEDREAYIEDIKYELETYLKDTTEGVL